MSEQSLEVRLTFDSDLHELDSLSQLIPAFEIGKEDKFMVRILHTVAFTYLLIVRQGFTIPNMLVRLCSFIYIGGMMTFRV